MNYARAVEQFITDNEVRIMQDAFESVMPFENAQIQWRIWRDLKRLLRRNKFVAFKSLLRERINENSEVLLTAPSDSPEFNEAVFKMKIMESVFDVIEDCRKIEIENNHDERAEMIVAVNGVPF